MTITANDPFRSAPRISRDEFRRRINMHAAPGVIAERDAGAYWDAIAATGVDPLFLLAMFNHESTMGKFGMARTTHSWGNTRPPSFGVPHIRIENNFSVYRDWLDGCKSTAARLVAPEWVYHDRVTIRDIFIHPSGKVWAPAGDNNDPNGYLNAVIRDMNAWSDGGAPMAGDDSRFTWMPDVSEFGYPQGTRGRNGRTIDLGIIHYTQGTDSSGWLRGNNGSSTHYLTDRAMRPREQHVREADAAWTAGNREYNLRGINVEGELPGDQWTPELIREFARTTYPIWKRNNIPLVYLGEDSGPGKRGLIGHADVPDQDHTDPGATFDWPLYIAELRSLDGAPAPPPPDDDWPAVPVTVPEIFRPNPYGIFWIPKAFAALMAGDHFMSSGYVVSEAFAWTNPDGEVLVVQYTERRRYELHRDGSVTLGLVGLEAMYATHPERRP